MVHNFTLYTELERGWQYNSCSLRFVYRIQVIFGRGNFSSISSLASDNNVSVGNVWHPYELEVMIFLIDNTCYSVIAEVVDETLLQLARHCQGSVLL